MPGAAGALPESFSPQEGHSGSNGPHSAPHLGHAFFSTLISAGLKHITSSFLIDGNMGAVNRREGGGEGDSPHGDQQELAIQSNGEK